MVKASHPFDGSRDPFQTERVERDLKGYSIRGGTTTVATQAAVFALKLVSTVVLARLLTPKDFGLFAMVTAVTGFLVQFSDAGLSAATVQRESITHRQISTLFWANLLLGAALAALALALAPLLALFYGEPRVTGIAFALALPILLTGLTIQHRALLRRQMRFRALAAIGIISEVAGVVAAIVMATMGAGYWALTAIPVVTAGTSLLLIWIIHPWKPGWPVRGSGVRTMFRFGAKLTGARVLSYASSRLDKALLGATWGAGPLGLYSRAFRLLEMPIYLFNLPANQVALPALSRLRGEPERFLKFYGTGITLLTSLSMPLVVFIFYDAEDLVRLILGPQWTGAVPIFRALSPAAFIATFNIASNWVFIPFGRTGRQLRAAFFGSALTVFAFFMGLPWGPFGVAVAFSLATALTFIPVLLYAYYETPLRLAHLGRAILRPAAAALAAGILLFFLEKLLFGGFENIFFKVPALFLLYGFSYGGLYAASPGGLQAVKSYANFLPHLRSREIEN